MTRTYFSIILLAVFLLFPAYGQADNSKRVVVISDLWMPYNGVPGTEPEGYAVDILRRIFEPQGYTIDYFERPWKRAIDDVKAGRADILIGAFKFEMPSFVFPETTIGETLMGFYTNKPGWAFSGRESLREIEKIGIVQGYGYRQWLLDEAKASPGHFHLISGEDAFPRLVDMLTHNRVQAIPSSPTVMDYYIKSNSLTGIYFAGYGPNPTSEKLYFALSPTYKGRSKKLASMIDKGMAELRDSGELDRILAVYGLRDWQ